MSRSELPCIIDVELQVSIAKGLYHPSNRESPPSEFILRL